MNIAFDWGRCLEINESVRQLAREAFAAGHGVFVVPALGFADFPYEQTLASLNVPVTAIHRVRLEPPFPEAVAVAKVCMMKKLGCVVLYDDLASNVEVAMAAGIEGVLVREGEDVSRPSWLAEGK